MSSTIEQTPETELLESWFDSQAYDKSTITVFGRCAVEYNGRAESTLEKGDRLVVFKPDGTVLVHTDEKTAPQNWQPPGAETKIIDTNPFTIRAERSNPTETLVLSFDMVHHAAKMVVEDDASFEFHGSEKDMQQYVFENPSVIEDGLRTIEREYETGAGPVDIRGVDADGETVLLELKRRDATPRDAEQLDRYLSHVDEDPRGILVTPSFSDRVKQMLKSNDLEYVAVDPPSRGADVNTSLTDFDSH